MSVPAIQLTLPATSANLGSGFDACGLAMSLWLEVTAQAAEVWQLHAVGRDAASCGQLEGHLIVETCRSIWRDAGVREQPLALQLDNGIPLGMGCGSSAAALVAGVVLGVHFGELGWTDEQIVAEACRREGHPDNVAACWYGGFVTAVKRADGGVDAASFAAHEDWPLLLVLPPQSLSTQVARSLLPGEYLRVDAIWNVARAALLVAAFAQGRRDLLRSAMGDRLHQPYRMAACPLLQELLPLADQQDVAGVALSGAGPSVLLIGNGTDHHPLEELVRAVLPDEPELLRLRMADGARRKLLA